MNARDRVTKSAAKLPRLLRMFFWDYDFDGAGKIEKRSAKSSYLKSIYVAGRVWSKRSAPMHKCLCSRFSCLTRKVCRIVEAARVEEVTMYRLAARGEAFWR